MQSIENDRKIDWDTDSNFLYGYQRALLLGLKEQGCLDEMQFRYAEQKLKEQLRTFVKKKLSCNTKYGGEEND